MSLLYNNSIIVKSQKQITPICLNGNIEKQTHNANETSHDSITLPTVEGSTISAPSTPISISTSSVPVFNVTTMNYQGTSGDPSLAIQNAINSLPQNRTAPQNIILQGVFNSVQNVFLEDNINFIGENAVVVGVNNTKMFVLNPNETTFSEVHKAFSIDGYDNQFVDWVNLHNVTFQSIDFQHPFSPASGDYAIYCFQSNSTGWGINDNININNCTFTGFYSGFYGLPINSCFENNVFRNYTSNGFMLPYGLNITIRNNTFDSPSTDPQLGYPVIGLHLLDVNVSCIVYNNSFITGDYSTGLAIVSSTGNIIVTNNIFLGNGEPIAVDFYPRPFKTEGLYVYVNIGQADFSIQ